MPAEKEKMMREVFEQALRRRASDIHFSPGIPPVFRIDGKLVVTDGKYLEQKDMDFILAFLTTEPERFQLKKAEELDFSYKSEDYGQFRGNAFLCGGNPAIALRLLPKRIPSLSELGHSKTVTELSLNAKGLVLITGPTGSGKSTTAAAMLELISRRKACHIITLEDPIEYIFPHQRSIVHQREIGKDTASFSAGLRAALREDPDVIFVGELRDADGIAVALRAAFTGHFVLTTLHTRHAAQAVERIINAFPPEQQTQVKLELAMVLQGIISQRLLKKKDETGRIAAAEIMTATPAVQNLIREGKTHQLFSCIQTGGRFGMQTMEQALEDLYKNGRITQEEMMAHTFSAEDF